MVQVTSTPLLTDSPFLEPTFFEMLRDLCLASLAARRLLALHGYYHRLGCCGKLLVLQDRRIVPELLVAPCTTCCEAKNEGDKGLLR